MRPSRIKAERAATTFVDHSREMFQVPNGAVTHQVSVGC